MARAAMVPRRADADEKREVEPGTSRALSECGQQHHSCEFGATQSAVSEDDMQFEEDSEAWENVAPLPSPSPCPDSCPDSCASDFRIASMDTRMDTETTPRGGDSERFFPLVSEAPATANGAQATSFAAASGGDAPLVWEGVEAAPIRFRSREDKREYVGQVVRRVKLLGREYLMVRTEPSPDRLKEGLVSSIHLCGIGFRHSRNDDIEFLSDIGQSPQPQCDAPREGMDKSGSRMEGHMSGCQTTKTSDGNGTDHDSDREEDASSDSSSESGCKEEAYDEPEPGLFVPDGNQFRRAELLGSGGFADVYRYVRLDKNGDPTREAYAVKEVDIHQLSLRCGTNQECLVRWIARLECEVRNQLKLNGHPGLVMLHDAFAHRSRFYIVMELVHGTDLGRRLQSRGRIPEVETRSIFAQAAEALRHSHALGVVHRDFKPGNVLLVPARPGYPECVKLTDFGLSKDLSGSDGGIHGGTATPFLGTKYYRAPETRHVVPGHDSYDEAKVDVFALGVTLFAMLSGCHPPEGEEVSELSFRGAFWKRVSSEAKDLLLRVLRHDPDERLSLDDVIEHQWLCVPWRVEGEATPVTKRVEASEETTGDIIGKNNSFLNLPPPRTDESVDAANEEKVASMSMAATPKQFLSAFPEAPASSSAAKIPAVAKNSNSPQKSGSQVGGAPGWGNVFSWLRANAAAAEAQKVLNQAGMVSGSSATFGKTPLVNVSHGSAEQQQSAGMTVVKSVENIKENESVEVRPQESIDTNEGEGTNVDTNANKLGIGHIQWITCAPRFASTWRYAQSPAQLPSSPAPIPSPCPSPPPSPWDELEETTALGMERRRVRVEHENRPSIIGFVHAPQNEVVDGVMVTITCKERLGERILSRPWGFISEVKKEFGFGSREESMRAAERALLPACPT